MPTLKIKKTYLGDSVYADWDGDLITLTVEEGENAHATIYLDEQTYQALLDFCTRIVESQKKDVKDVTNR